MVSYRFCRPDDIPRLVEAVELCFRVHFPAADRLTVEGFREEMRLLDVWPSNSMIAAEGDDPVAVLIGTKRSREVLVHRIGVRPGHERRGHARHLVDSLSHKLAVLGPERLVAEVPQDLPQACAFFAAAGYEQEAELTDWELAPDALPAPAGGLVTEGTLADLERSGVSPPAAEASWARQPESLRATTDLRAAVLAGVERVEAWLVYRGVEQGADVLAIGCTDRSRQEAAWRLLFGHLQRAVPGRVRLAAFHASEAPYDVLSRLGFAAAGRRYRLVARACPA